MTIAETIAARFADGMTWKNDAGEDLIATCEDLGRRTSKGIRCQLMTRWTFEDGSAIIAGENAWDLGFTGIDCFCWAGEGRHDDDCQHGSGRHPRDVEDGE